MGKKAGVGEDEDRYLRRSRLFVNAAAGDKLIATGAALWNTKRRE